MLPYLVSTHHQPDESLIGPPLPPCPPAPLPSVHQHHFANTRQAQPGSNPGAMACDASDVRGNAVRITWEGKGKSKGTMAGRNTSHSPMDMDSTRTGVGLRKYDPKRQRDAAVLGKY